MHQMSQKEIKDLRELLATNNDNLCPLCEQVFDVGEMALDHCHESGQIRGTICKRCNSLEGIFRSRWVRSGVAKKVSLETYMRNLADYLDKEHLPILHPSHAPKPRKLMISSYNSLVKEIKAYNKVAAKTIKIPPYPKSKRLVKKLKELYDKFGIYPKFYSK